MQRMQGVPCGVTLSGFLQTQSHVSSAINDDLHCGRRAFASLQPRRSIATKSEDNRLMLALFQIRSRSIVKCVWYRLVLLSEKENVKHNGRARNAQWDLKFDHPHQSTMLQK